jgi:hypothetical protein
MINIKFSNPYKESSFEFILNCDVLIAGDSSIHLDARLLNVESFYFDFTQGSRIVDLYGFRKNGFVSDLQSIESIIQLIESGIDGENVFIKAKYYNSLVGSENESSSSQLAYSEYAKFLLKS